jgi:hypothetical protein
MGGLDTIITVRMSLNAKPESSQLECALTYQGDEFSRTSTPLLNQELLKGYRQEIALAILGLPEASNGVSSVQRELGKIIPPEAAAFLRKATAQRPEASTLSLEVMLNNPAVLDLYPWELLSQPGLLVDPRIAVVVWRSVPKPRLLKRPSSAVLLVGSASFDTISTNAPGEIAFLAEMLEDSTGIHPWQRPSVTFAQFAELIKALEPSVIHIITHGDIDGFQFQQYPDFSRSHVDIPAQEIGTYLATPGTANLIFLNACHSASQWDGRPCMARQIAERSSAATIGMSAEIPNIVGFDFSKNFFRALVSGESLIEAFGSAARSIRQENKFARLWSAPIMYAPPDSNVVLFPTAPTARLRLRCQELGRQLRQLDSEIAALTDYYHISGAAGSTPGVGAIKLRLAYIRDLVNELGTPALEEPARVRVRLLVSQRQAQADPALAQLRVMLEGLQDPTRSRQQRGTASRSIRSALSDQIQAFDQLEFEFSDS